MTNTIGENISALPLTLGVLATEVEVRPTFRDAAFKYS